jgi:Sporulation and spore germination/L,D-transpeptidase catalytic domain/Putative peptidoglycan binding domain
VLLGTLRAITTTRRCVIALLAIAAALAAVTTTPAAAAPATPHVSVYFLQGEQLAPVSRPGTTAADALRELIAGPTATEAQRGFRTYVPAGTRVLSVGVAGGVATVDLTEAFGAGSDPDSLLARLSELVRTLTGIHGASKVQLLLNGKPASGRFPGIPTSGPITFHYLQTPNIPVPQPPALRLVPPETGVKTVQQQLIALGYLLPGDADGRFGPATQNAILAFQKWERLGRTGLLDAATTAQLQVATHPTPITQGGAGKRAEILLDRQVALLIDNDQVVRTIAVSTGKPSTPTPPGNYRVYAKIPKWWSTPFREWLPWALPFVGGIAFHEFLDVPSYPASHGCVRQAVSVAHWTYDFASVGMPVKVIARS